MNHIKGIRFTEIKRPMRTLFSTSLGQKDVMRSVIVKALLRNGCCGVGEIPTSHAFPHETILAIKGILKEISRALSDVPIDEYTGKIKEFRTKYAPYRMTISGLEVSLFRAYLSSKGIGEHSHWGALTRDVDTDITIPFILNGPLLKTWITHVLRKGFRIFKLKISGDVELDRKFLSTVSHMLKDNLDAFSLRLDGNQGYNEETFFRIMAYVEKEGLAVELFEQPLQRNNYKGLREIKKQCPIPIVLDETIQTVQDLQRAIDDHLCDGVNIKIAKSGIKESVEMLNLARQTGLKVMIGCMTETMVGLSAGIYWAAGSHGFDFVDLDSIYFIHHKNRYGSIELRGPSLVIS